MSDMCHADVPTSYVDQVVGVMARERVPLILETPARTRFLSCDPLPGPVDLLSWIHGGGDVGAARRVA